MSTIRYMLCIALWIWSVILPWTLLGTVTTIIAGFLLLMYPAWDSKKKDSNGHPNKPRHEKWFYAWIIGLSALGGFWALFLPLALNQKFDGPNADGNQLRLHLLYITGGVLALTTLGETHRKNTLEKHKNDQDHTRQVHAERRSRYTAAIEQLSSDKASIRLGGVYTLVGLVDEWLSDEKTTSSPEERHKEGQVIINNLCAYIRSPLPLAERAEQLDKDYAKDLQNDFDGDIEKFDADKRAFARDKAALEEERQVRQSIIEEIHKRLQYIGTPGSWSKLDYDFSNAHFFYPIDFVYSYFGVFSNFSGVTFTEDANFFGAEFTGGANFFGATFLQDANFSRAAFTRDADFFGAKFTGYANFFKAEFTGSANFSKAEFTGSANFSWAKFTGNANFSWAKFTGNANFSWAKFTEDADFSGVEFTKDADFSGVEFTKDADFSGVEFTKDANFSGVEFTKDANFSEAEFTGNANFSGVEFTKDADFSEAEFTGNANFFWAKFTEDTDFSGVEFTGDANFFEAEFTGNADFSKAEFTGNANFFEAEFTGNADFSKAKFTDAHFSWTKFTGNANFFWAKFTKASFSRAKFTDAHFFEAEFTGNADFSGVEFTGSADFSGATFEEKPIFERALGDKTYKARFSYKADPEDYNFKVSHNSRYKIETEEQEHNGTKFTIPKGAELFDPDEPSE